jgi:hypothetical protein
VLLLVYWALESARAGPGSGDHCVAVSFLSQRHFAAARAARRIGTASARPCCRRSQPGRGRRDYLRQRERRRGRASGASRYQPVHFSRLACRDRRRIGRGKIEPGWTAAGLASRRVRQRFGGWRRAGRCALDQLRASHRVGGPGGAAVEPAARRKPALWFGTRLPCRRAHRCRGIAARDRSASQRPGNSARRRRRIGLGRRRPARAPGRALLRPGVRLAILDEPFRGLDFDQRHKLLARARELARCHAAFHFARYPEAMAFERVLVMEDGPSSKTAMANCRESRFHAMLEAESAIRDEFWNGPEWRHLRLHNGQLTS